MTGEPPRRVGSPEEPDATRQSDAGTGIPDATSPPEKALAGEVLLPSTSAVSGPADPGGETQAAPVRHGPSASRPAGRPAGTGPVEPEDGGPDAESAAPKTPARGAKKKRKATRKKKRASPPKKKAKKKTAKRAAKKRKRATKPKAKRSEKKEKGATVLQDAPGTAPPADVPADVPSEAPADLPVDRVVPAQNAAGGEPARAEEDGPVAEAEAPPVPKDAPETVPPADAPTDIQTGEPVPVHDTADRWPGDPERGDLVSKSEEAAARDAPEAAPPTDVPADVPADVTTDAPAPVQDAAGGEPGTPATDGVTAAVEAETAWGEDEVPDGPPAGARSESPALEMARDVAGDGEAVELSPEEALDLLASLTSPEPAVLHPVNPVDACQAPDVSADELREEAIGPVPCEPDLSGPTTRVASGSAPAATRRGVVTLRPPRFRVLTFEAVPVEPAMRVAGCTLARLSDTVRRGELGALLGPVCETAGEFLAEWLRTPDECPVVVLANLSSAGDFISRVAHECPGAETAYWIVFETLRSDVSITTNRFLAELSSEGRLRAVGYGPRNVVEAARSGAEAAVGHVEWGFGSGAYLAEAG